MKRYLHPLLSAAFGLAVFCAFAFPLRAVLNYHEQYQLFLLTPQYLTEHLCRPGGLSVYLGEAVVQCYNSRYLGAALLALQLMAVQWLARKLWKRWFALSFIPPVALLVLLGDVNVMHSAVMVFIIALTLAVALRRLPKAIAIPVWLATFYWTCWCSHYRVPGSTVSFKNIYDSKTYELIDYDRMVRGGDWQGIIKKARRKKADLPMSVCATNLALGMTGRLREEAKQFYQNGTAGLVPPFQREPFATLTTAEMYYQMGLVNTAQRYVFEAMEAIPNYNKSSRCIRRLAETNLVNGQYAVARKYLGLLCHAPFYRKWAERTLALIDKGEEAIDAHPMYGRLRRYRLTDDFLFSDKEADRIFGQLFMHNTDNHLAMQYLLLYPQLEGNAEKYMQYLQVVKTYMK